MTRLLRPQRSGNHEAARLNEFVKDKQFIFHLGGVNRGTEEEINTGNVLATQKLLRAVSQYGSSRTHIVFASSGQVYTLPEDKTPLRETDRADPMSLYGISKKAAEDLIIESGLPHTILRLSNVYGPGCRPDYNSVIATFCHRAASRQPLTLHGDGSQGRDFVYIDDVIQAFILCGVQTETPPNDCFNVSSGRIVSLKQIIDTLNQVGAEILVTRKLKSDQRDDSYCCDATRIRRRYGWEPRTSLADGLKRTLCDFKLQFPSTR